MGSSLPVRHPRLPSVAWRNGWPAPRLVLERIAYVGGESNRAKAFPSLTLHIHLSGMEHRGV